MRRKELSALVILVVSVLLLAASFGQTTLSPQPKASIGNGNNGTLPVLTNNFTLTVYNATHVRYLRTEVFVRYENGHWLPGGGNLTGPEKPEIPFREAVDRVTVSMNFRMNGTVPLPLHTTRIEGVNCTLDNGTGLCQSEKPFSKYTFTSVTYYYDYSYLVNLTPPKNRIYTYVPQDVLPALMPLLMSFNESSLSYYETIFQADIYLLWKKRVVREPSFPPNVDEIMYFLKNGTEGSPYDFASSIALFARAIGVPARLVEGYKITPYPGKQVLNASRKTYWVELYFNQTGWITFDPLDPLGNVYEPLRVKAVPPILNLTVGSRGILSFHLLSVLKRVNLKVLSAEDLVGGVNFSTYSVNVSVDSPAVLGAYPVVLTDGGAIYGVAWVVSGNVLAEFPRDAVRAYPGGSTRKYRVVLRDVNGNLSFSTSEWVRVISANSIGNNETEVWFTVTPPLSAKAGPHIQWIEFKTEGLKVAFYFPVEVYEPVRIEITNPPTVVSVGRGFRVAGNVTMAIPDAPVNGGTIVVTVSRREWKVMGVGNVSNGKFNVTALFPRTERPGFRDVRVFYYPAYLNFSPVLSEVAPLGSVYVIQETNFMINRTVITRAGPFVLTGRLVDLAGRGVPNVTLHYLPPRGNFSNTTTDSEGYFMIPLTLELGLNPVLLDFSGDGLYNRSMTLVHIYGVRLKVPEVIQAEIGRTVTLNGTVEGLDNGTIRVTFGGSSESVEIRNGTFSVRIGPFESAGEFIVYFWGTSTVLKTLRVAVFSPIDLRLRTPKLFIGSNETLVIEAEDGVGNPVPGLPLHIEFPGFNGTVQTNIDGKASVYVLHAKPGKITVTVTYRGSTFYYPTTATFKVEVVEESMNPLLYALPIVGAAAAIGALYYRRKRGVEGLGSGPVGIIVPGGVPIFEKGEKVEFELLCDGELRIDGKPVKTREKVGVSLEEGEHEVELRCDGQRFKTRVKVVGSYSEVVCRMYEKCFLEWAKKRVPVEGFTPREIESALEAQFLPREPLETIRKTFEVAEYGRRRLSRGEFLRFYRALERLTGVTCDA